MGTRSQVELVVLMTFMTFIFMSTLPYTCTRCPCAVLAWSASTPPAEPCPQSRVCYSNNDLLISKQLFCSILFDKYHIQILKMQLFLKIFIFSGQTLICDECFEVYAYSPFLGVQYFSSLFRWCP